MDEETEVTFKGEMFENTELKNSLELFCKKQEEFKKNLVRCVNQIKELISNDGDLKEIEIRKNRLENKFKNIISERDALHGEEKNAKFSYDWIDELEALVDDTAVAVEVFLRTKMSPEKMQIDLNKIIAKTDEFQNEVKVEKEKRFKEGKGDSFEYVEDHIENSEHDVSTNKNDQGDSRNSIFTSLKKVKLPNFSGKIREYANWASSFAVCIDQTSISAEAKLLHLRQCLTGEAAKVLDGIGHTAEAYELAKQRLGRRYGGERRKIALYLEEVEGFNRIRPGNSLDLERFANLLDILALNLKESDLTQELGSGLLFVKLQQKLHKNLLASFHRWIHENKKEGSVLSLREFILRETEFDIIAEETTRGLSNAEPKSNSFMTTSSNNQVRPKKCVLCGETHDLKICSKFLDMNLEERGQVVQKFGLCFGCLGRGHLKKDCKKEVKCLICEKNHNAVFHRETDSSSFHGRFNSLISLRTLPIKISHGNRELIINCILDDGSSQSFLNADVARYLNLAQTDQQKIIVGVLNGASKSFSSASVSVGISAANGSETFQIDLMTTENVTGTLKPFDWTSHAFNFAHLRNIPFTPPAKGKIDLLLGLDNAFLHKTLQEVSGSIGQPIARLTPIGWTCVGNTGLRSMSGPSSRFVSTFFQNSGLDKIDESIKRFWEIDESREVDPMSASEKEILSKSLRSIKYNNVKRKYKVSIPWKGEIKLPNNYPMAFKRLENTEKKLMKQENIKIIYNQTIQKYVAKGYVKLVDTPQISPTGWLLPHFPVVNTNKLSTKVRIVFDASANFQNISLNDSIFCGPKLQANLINVLVRFRMRKIGLACDVHEMFLQIEMAEEDRKYHRFLWRDVDVTKEPRIYEFNRLVFGNTASPFLAQLISRHNAEKHQKKFPRAAETILSSTFMDDSLDSIHSVEEGNLLYLELKKLWALGGMSTHKWITNSAELLELIPEADRGISLDISDNRGDIPKALGVRWDHKKDVLSFNAQKQN